MTRNKLITLVLAVFSATFCLGQTSGYLGIGYNRAFLNLQELNDITSEYNTTRGYLDTQMAPFNGPGGVTVNYCIFFNRLALEAGYTAQKQKRFAEGYDATNQLVRRQTRIRMNHFNAAVGYRVLSSRFLTLIPSVGAQTGVFSLHTRVGHTDAVKSVDWSKPVKRFNGAGIAQLHFLFGNAGINGIKLMVTPYYSYSLSEMDIYPFNEAINSATAPNGENPINVSPHYFGMKLQIIFYGGAIN